ncbi:hypothetical protein RRG08_043538 [Elysia crispata]|uniref:Uncharacterized protein n=1 Tax=Elysia crispata TaxID=231223 RepID=A0AAE1CXQ4_9GAST|nr:hypothetical protein RRG08_043538 [Elysia crispata]
MFDTDKGKSPHYCPRPLPHPRSPPLERTIRSASSGVYVIVSGTLISSYWRPRSSGVNRLNSSLTWVPLGQEIGERLLPGRARGFSHFTAPGRDADLACLEVAL